MPMIPLPFALAAALLFFLVREVERTERSALNWFFVAFLSLLIFQLVLIGARFGYGYESLILIQPLTAALIPSLAYLSFLNPAHERRSERWKIGIHVLPLVCIVATTTFARDFIDLSLGAFALLYASALTHLGLRGQDAMPWVELNRSDHLYRALWLTVGLLILSGVTDVLIGFDFWSTDGANTASIAGKASIVGSIVFGLIVIAIRQMRNLSQSAVEREAEYTRTENREKEKHTLARVTDLLGHSPLHLEPNLNLNRLARKLGIPARQVSQSINRQLGVSVSQFVNDLRIEQACKLLAETDQTVTSIMLQTGFNTKSNFNREFSRRYGLSPSNWRKLDDTEREKSAKRK